MEWENRKHPEVLKDWSRPLDTELHEADVFVLEAFLPKRSKGPSGDSPDRKEHARIESD